MRGGTETGRAHRPASRRTARPGLAAHRPARPRGAPPGPAHPQVKPFWTSMHASSLSPLSAAEDSGAFVGFADPG